MENPAIAVLQVQRDAAATELAAHVAAAKAAKARVRAFDEALGVLRGSGVVRPHPRGTGVKTTLADLIVTILEDNSGLNTQQIMDALAAKGRSADRNTVLGTLSRCRGNSLIHKRDKSWYPGPGPNTSFHVPTTSGDQPSNASEHSTNHVGTSLSAAQSDEIDDMLA